MTTTWKSGDNQSKTQKSDQSAVSNHSTISAASLASWSREQKLAMIAGFGVLGLLLIVSACSKQSTKPALAITAQTAPSAPASTLAPTPASVPASPAAPAKKTSKKRPANVNFSDSNTGISFLYPRKYALASGENARLEFAGMGDVPMNFAAPGGLPVATVALPGGSYPGTDFASAFFNVSINRGVSEQQCSQFAVVDSRNPDGEAIDAEKVNIGSSEMETTSNFSANAIRQTETQYFHRYENGACYEYVLALNTEGFTTINGIKHVNRDEVFARLNKILETMKITPAEQQRLAQQAETSTSGNKD